MKNFIYNTPTKVFFGAGEVARLGEVLKQFKAKKILFHYGQKSIKTTGLYDLIVAQLKDFEVYELMGVEPNPKLWLAKEGIKIVKDKEIDFILAVGGGSVVDSAKLIACGSLSEADPWEFSTGKLKVSQSLPIGVILTIAASGSDMSSSCVITNEMTKEKRGFNSEFNRPVFAILDPKITYTVSKYQTACGVVDILMHTLERFISFDEPNILTDNLAIALLKSVLAVGKTAVDEPTNYEARATLLWANSLSHNGLTSCGKPFVMSVHQLEHELSGMFDEVAHGAGLAVLWPAWAKFAYKNATKSFARLAYDVLEIPKEFEVEKAILTGIEQLKNYFKSLGLPTSLKELGVPKEACQSLAKNVTFNHQRVIKDVITIDEESALKIYLAAWD